MENQITQENLQAVMIDKLKNLNPDVDPETLNGDTVLGDVLSVEENVSNSATIFKETVEFDIKNNGSEVKPWDPGWLGFSISKLAGSLLMILFLFISTISFGQLNASISAVKTDLKNGAVAFSLSYLKSLDSLYGGKEQAYFGKHSVFAFTPVFDIETGTADAMSSINVKMTGLLIDFKTKQLSGLTVSDLSKTFHTFPVSAGIETNNKFNFINGIFEAGYVPWFTGTSHANWLRHTKLGIFLQAGYKFKLDSTGKLTEGGATDQSDEALNSKIFRVKGSLSINTKKLFQINLVKFGIVASADGWYDVINHAVYHRLQGVFRVYLTDSNFLDLNFTHGSGAPNFNEGDQYGIGLTVQF